MNREGHQLILDAISEVAGQASVSPYPGEEEDVVFLTIETRNDIPPALILNALYKANLLKECVRNNASLDPELRAISVQPGNLTFEDIVV
jgi:hypothetical protein